MITKTINAIKRDIKESVLNQITWLPAKIVKYNPQKRTVDIEFLVQLDDGNGDFYDLPKIPNVPLMQYSCGLFTFQIPLTEGDTVAIIFTNQGIGNWKNRGGLQEENSMARGLLQNCFAIPSIFPVNKSPNSDNSFEITQAGELKIKMQKSATIEVGDVKIFTNISNQMEKVIAGLTQIATALTALSGVVIPPMSPSPQPLLVANNLTSASVNITTIANQITQLKQQLDQVI